MKFDMQMITGVILGLAAIALIVAAAKKKERFQLYSTVAADTILGQDFKSIGENQPNTAIGKAVLGNFLNYSYDAWRQERENPSLIADGYPQIGPGAIRDFDLSLQSKLALQDETERQMRALGLPYPAVYTEKPAYGFQQ